MKDKYWVLILIGIIILAGLAMFLVLQNATERYYRTGYDEGYDSGYNKKICVCIDNYDKGYNDGYAAHKKYCDERIDYCFNKCNDIVCFMIVGGCEDAYRACLWKCFHPDYGIVKIN